METVNNNSCIMLACALYTPVSLSSVFDSSDLKETGIEVESHVTLLYARGINIPREEVLSNIELILGEEVYSDFIEMLKDSKSFKVFDFFELSIFENDSDFIVLKMKKDNDYFKTMSLINKSLSTKYKVSSDFSSYTPHITLAKLNSGAGKKYLNSNCLKRILEDSRISIEDVTISYGSSDTPIDREKYNLTTFNAVPRYFREQNLRDSLIIEE